MAPWIEDRDRILRTGLPPSVIASAPSKSSSARPLDAMRKRPLTARSGATYPDGTVRSADQKWPRDSRISSDMAGELHAVGKLVSTPRQLQSASV